MFNLMLNGSTERFVCIRAEALSWWDCFLHRRWRGSSRVATDCFDFEFSPLKNFLKYGVVPIRLGEFRNGKMDFLVQVTQFVLRYGVHEKFADDTGITPKRATTPRSQYQCVRGWVKNPRCSENGDHRLENESGLVDFLLELYIWRGR